MAKDKCPPQQIKQFPKLFKERISFKSQLLSKVAVKIAANTIYEELACAGFQPDFNRLEAVVYIKQPVGYSGGICTSGSKEYVRFFLSFDGGATWEDQGVTSFTAYDIPEAEEQRLEYAVTLEIDPDKKFCFFDNLVLARAILSWELEPPPGNPNFIPPWGNVHDTHIQIDPIKFIPFGDLLSTAQLNLPPQLAEIVDVSEPVPVLKKKSTLSIHELDALYKNKNVETHRYGFSLAQKILTDSDFNASLVGGIQGEFAQSPFNWSDILEAVLSLDGNTSYEELECVGLNPDTSELIATLRIKRPSGFSGGLCTNGSNEYVTFWGDFDMDGSYEVCLGTASVNVHDFEDIPEEGLEYSVFLPVNLLPYRQPCQDGPKLAGIRAILSWNVPHPCSLPNVAPYWGNTEDTVIQIPAGPVVEGDDIFRPYLYSLCSRHVCTIDQGTGLSTGDRPFGGVIWIRGEIPAGPAITTPDRFKYKVQVRQAGAAWQTLDNKFPIKVTSGSSLGTAFTTNLVQEVDASGYYTYREYGTPLSGNWRRVTAPNRALAKWITTADDIHLWEIRIEALDTLTGITYAAGTQICPDGTTRQNVFVKLEQERPEIVSFTIDEFERDGVTQPAAECGKFQVGDIIRGSYHVTDEHFRVMTLKVLPKDEAGGATVNPASRTYYAPDFVPTTGETGTWELNTSGMLPCGYVVLLEVWDRLIYSCDSDGRYNRESVGFCLEEVPPTP